MKRISVATAVVVCLFSGVTLACEFMSPTDAKSSFPANATQKPTQLVQAPATKAKQPTTVARGVGQGFQSGTAKGDPKTVAVAPTVALACEGGKCI